MTGVGENGGAVVSTVLVSTSAMRRVSSMTCSVSRSSSSAAGVAHPVDLEAAEIDALLDLPAEPLDHLAHALARSVVDVVGRAAAAQVHATGAGP